MSAAWSALAAGFEPLGAVASRVENEETLSCCIVLPGPPQSVEVLLVGVGGQRFALPVAGVAGVLHRPQIAEADFADDAEAERANLAALLGWPDESPEADAESTNQVLLASGPQQRVACLVDAVYQRERVLVRSPGPLLANNPWVWAVIVREHSPPTLVLDVPALVPALLAAATPA